jgi:hypothetical protein
MSTIKQWVPFNYDRWVRHRQPQLQATSAYVHFVLQVKIHAVDIPGEYPLLCTSEKYPFLMNFRGDTISLPKGFNVQMEIEVEEPTTMWLVSYSIKDLGPDETIHRRTTRTLYATQAEAKEASKHWPGHTLHQIVIPA